MPAEDIRDIGPYTAGVNLAGAAGSAARRDTLRDVGDFRTRYQDALDRVNIERRKRTAGAIAGGLATAATLGGAALLAPAVAAVPGVGGAAGTAAVPAGSFLGLSAGTLRSLAPVLGSISGNIFGGEDPAVTAGGRGLSSILERRAHDERTRRID